MQTYDVEKNKDAAVLTEYAKKLRELLENKKQEEK